MSDRLSRNTPSPVPAPHIPSEPLAFPPVAALPHDIARHLRDLPAREMLFVDATGKLHKDKSEMLVQKIPPLVSFRKESEGSFRVYGGLPPRNPTHCGSGTVPAKGALTMFPDMESPVVLNSGDWIALTAKLPLSIPTFRNPSPTTAEGKLSELIANAEIGDTLVLGRKAVKECPGEVSRAHITIKILDRVQHSPTRVQLRVLAIPGIEGTQPIYAVKPNGELEKILANARIPAGGTIQIGEQGERLTLPYPKNSLDEASVMYHQSILLNDPNANQSVMSVFGREGLQQAQFKALYEYVGIALAMIRDGRYADALEHLRTESKELGAAGYVLSENNQIALQHLNPAHVEKNLFDVAQRSWFKAPQKTIYPSVGVRAPELEPTNEEERKLLSSWEKNIALLYAEEYIHALQDMHGGAISDYAPLFGGKELLDEEADVALVYTRLGIDLSDGLFTNRYPSREVAMQRIAGVQTKEEELRFTTSILSAPLKTPVEVHGEVTVTRTEEGYLVVPIGNLAGRHYLTAHGPARTIRKPIVLQGGDKLFLGNRTFTLPLVDEQI